MPRVIQQQKTHTLLTLLVPCIIILYASLVASVCIRYNGQLDAAGWNLHLKAFTVVFGVWLVILYAHRLFERQVARSFGQVVSALVSASVVNTIAAIVYFYFQPDLILTPRRFLLLVVVISAVLLCAWYWYALRVLQAARYNVYVLAAEGEYPKLERDLQDADYLGIRYAGTIVNNRIVLSELPTGSVVVVPSYKQQNDSTFIQQLFAARRHGVTSLSASQAYEWLFRRVPLEGLGEWWFLEHVEYGQSSYDAIKRVLDVCVGVLAGLVCVLLYVPIALLIRVDSRGPVMFAQLRVGYLGKVFTIYKFRTMSGGESNTWTEKNDARITRVGLVLRALRLDELPQSWNIFHGDMSLVGPRPEQVHFVETLRSSVPFYDERHAARPGLTGWSQLHVYAGTLEESKLKLEYDLYYIKHRGLLFDLEIVLKTAYQVLRGGGR